MTPTRFMTLALVCSTTAIPTAACGRSGKQTSPAAEVQTQTPVQQMNTPLTVTGCLRAGDADDTFVLTTARSTEGEQTATYQLLGGPSDQLRDQIGKRIEVTGVLSAQQRTESLSMTETTRRAKGTSGTPTVSTRTDVDVRHFDVQSVKPLGDRCETR
jgi:hypothetical protein